MGLLDTVDGIIKNVTTTGMKVTDFWSFKPTIELSSQLDNPDAVLSVPGIIKRNGYMCETHTVESQGYLLNVHRIPCSRNGVISPKTVLLQHGFFCSSADWILNGPGKALAYVLSEAGYDVWMSNVRGNQHSREHTKLDTKSKAYWNFSWHDVAEHDMPAIIDHIMKIKGEGTKITYVGHSMGTTILFAMLVLRPEYNNILAAGFALAPVAFFTDLKSPLKTIVPLATGIATVEMLHGSHEFIPRNSLIGKILHIKGDDLHDHIVKELAFLNLGASEKQFDDDVMPMFLANLGTGTSWKTLVHYTQGIEAGGKFQQFDYGHNNQEIYNSKYPPQYDLSKVTLPTTLFWATNDLLSSETDVKLLSKNLGTKPEMYLVPDPKFGHMDYMWAKDLKTLLLDKILDSLDKIYGK